MKRNIIMISALGIALSGYAATAPHSIWDSGMLKEAITAPAEVCAVTDKTMLLSGSYALRMDASCLPEKLEAFSVSAWVMPKSFDQYNELFRIESSEGRVLFSFQEKGTILSLSLIHI